MKMRVKALGDDETSIFCGDSSSRVEPHDSFQEMWVDKPDASKDVRSKSSPKLLIWIGKAAESS